MASSFVQLLLFDQAAQLADLFRDAADALGDGFKFEGELAALSAEGFDLNVRVGDLGFETAGFAVGSGQTFFGLRELVAQARRGGNGVEDGDARFFLLALDFGETRGGRGGVLLAENEIALRGGQIGGGGFENLAIGFALGFKRGQAMAGLRQLGFGRKPTRTSNSAQRSSLWRRRAWARSISSAIWLMRSRFSRNSASMA